MKKNFTKFVACLLLVLMVFSIIEPMKIIVLADELETKEESQMNNVDETTTLLAEKLADEQKLLEIWRYYRRACTKTNRRTTD